MIPVSVVSTVEAVSHATSFRVTMVTCAVCPSVIPRASSVASPAVTAAIHGVEMWVSEVEVVASRIACVYSEVPAACLPVQRTIEIRSCTICAVLPVEKYVAEIEVSLSPVVPVQVVVIIDTHQIIEIYLVCCFILVVSEVKLVRHLVGKEKCAFACLFVTHCRCR